MPAPRVFISSTCYDLKDIRENLKFFIRDLGYDPILSEDGNILYDPTMHVEDACLAEVAFCQMMVLIIGGRYGSEYKETDKSITNAEYNQAVKQKIPVFTLVERPVLDQYFYYLDNLKNTGVEADRISYSTINDIRIFHFISEVRDQEVNNAIAAFATFEEISNYLKQQWASLLYNYLAGATEIRPVENWMSFTSEATSNIEFVSSKLMNKFDYDQTKQIFMLNKLIIDINNLPSIKYTINKIGIKEVLETSELLNLISKLGFTVYKHEDKNQVYFRSKDYIIGSTCRQLEEDIENYSINRVKIINKTKEFNIALDDIEKLLFEDE